MAVSICYFILFQRNKFATKQNSGKPKETRSEAVELEGRGPQLMGFAPIPPACPAGMGKAWAGGPSITANGMAMVAHTYKHIIFNKKMADRII